MAYDYDVAISFAGEQRAAAEAIATCIEAGGGRVFYDFDNQAKMWGKNLFDYLIDVYLKRARFCMILMSKEYTEKLWTNHERRAAQTRAFQEKGIDYILPVRMDDSEVPGILSTVGYVNFHSGGANLVCELFLEKLREVQREDFEPHGHIEFPVTAQPLSVSTSPYAYIVSQQLRTIAFIPVVRLKLSTQELEITLEPDDPTDGPFLDRLGRSRERIEIAYKTDVGTFQFGEMTKTVESGRSRWDLQLKNLNGDINSQLRNMRSDISDTRANVLATRLLLNQEIFDETKKNMNEIFRESFEVANAGKLIINHSFIPDLFRQFGSNPKRFLQVAWIHSVFQLLYLEIVQEIRTLTLSLDGEMVVVDFHGVRRPQYANRPAHEIRLHGSQELPKPAS